MQILLNFCLSIVIIIIFYNSNIHNFLQFIVFQLVGVKMVTSRGVIYQYRATAFSELSKSFEDSKQLEHNNLRQ